MRTPKGDKYNGEFHLNTKHGQGIYVWTNGNIYSGKFVRDMPFEGLLKEKDGDFILYSEGEPTKVVD